MSTDRSSSGVRNLRSIFETKGSENSPSTRGRSPGALNSGEAESQRLKSKVRASFVAVGPPPGMSTSEENVLERVSSAEKRRGSCSGGKSGMAVDEVKSGEQVAKVSETISESAVESAEGTPKQEVETPEKVTETHDKPAENPDKPVTGVEEEPADMKPAEPTSEAAVSGGEALPPVAEDLRPAQGDAREKTPVAAKAGNTKAKTTKPAPISTKDTAKATPSAAKSPASVPKPTQNGGLKKKASRSSLTAPTAASVARASAEKIPPVPKTPALPPKPKPRDPTKSSAISSHLTAPTAASRARHDPGTSTAAPSSGPSANGKTSLASRPKTQSTSSRPTPRSSLASARPESRSGAAAARKAAAPVDGSFLERMTRPTAASANRVHDKPDVKSPPRAKSVAAGRASKTNGHPKLPASKVKAEDAAAGGVDESSLLQEEAPSKPETDGADNATPAPEKSAKAVLEGLKPEQPGGETPTPYLNGAGSEVILEKTPAAIGGEDGIR